MKPIIGITLGDPCGIGPEILAKALKRREVYERCRPLAVGSAKVLARAARIVGADIQINPVKCVSNASFQPGKVDVTPSIATKSSATGPIFPLGVESNVEQYLK